MASYGCAQERARASRLSCRRSGPSIPSRSGTVTGRSLRLRRSPSSQRNAGSVRFPCSWKRMIAPGRSSRPRLRSIADSRPSCRRGCRRSRAPAAGRLGGRCGSPVGRPPHRVCRGGARDRHARVGKLAPDCGHRQPCEPRVRPGVVSDCAGGGLLTGELRPPVGIWRAVGRSPRVELSSALPLAVLALLLAHSDWSSGERA
jgi:hypothetical protein